jgi:LmbE family N-acetylglucosaminyl deacetylase
VASEPLRLLCVFAHPDDESLGAGNILAKYASEGVETFVITATRGERGWAGEPADFPGETALGEIRTAELYAAARVLGVHELVFLDYIDGDLDLAAPEEAIAKIVDEIRRIRPHVVVTFPPDGNYGHPDHIAISQFTQAALVCAADSSYAGGSASGRDQRVHRVAKLYDMVDSKALQDTLNGFGLDIGITVDETRRQLVTWPDWAITTWVDATEHWRTVWKAINCHSSQVAGMDDAPFSR